MATITLTLNAQQSTRVAAAVGAMRSSGLGDPTPASTPATIAEVEAFLLTYLRSIVLQKERDDAIRAISVVDL